MLRDATVELSIAQPRAWATASRQGVSRKGFAVRPKDSGDMSAQHLDGNGYKKLMITKFRSIFLFFNYSYIPVKLKDCVRPRRSCEKSPPRPPSSSLRLLASACKQNNTPRARKRQAPRTSGDGRSEVLARCRPGSWSRSLRSSARRRGGQRGGWRNILKLLGDGKRLKRFDCFLSWKALRRMSTQST